METVNKRVCILLILMMCEVEMAYTSSTDSGKEPVSGRLEKLQIQKDRFTRTPCQWDQGDKSVICKSMHLKRVPRDLTQNTMKLNLAENEITILLNTSFVPYPNLVTLDVSYNNLTTLQSAAFQPLKHLESLDLYGNYWLIIPSSVPFRPLQTLVSLDMHRCNLKDLPNDLMEWFPDLRYLDLSENRLSSLNVSRCKTDRLSQVLLFINKFQDLTPDKFMFVCPTDEFTLFMNPIRYISEDTIAALPVKMLSLGLPIVLTASVFRNLTSGVARSNITLLELREVELPNGIPKDVFRPLYDHKLQLLAIESSTDLRLDKDVFLGLNCFELSLSVNVLPKIEPEYFRGITSIQHLTLRKNQIIHFNPNNITWESNFECLDMSQNGIFTIHGYQFHGLNNLKYLNLSNNANLVWVDLFSYSALESLEIIDISGTPITELRLPSDLSQLYFPDLIVRNVYYPFIPGVTFKNSKKLEVIDISHTKLSREHIWDPYYDMSLFRGLIKLIDLHLSNNPLGNLPNNVFNDNSMLVHLMLDNCKISSLTGMVFEGLHSLRHLHLNGNYLVLISANALKYLATLQTLGIDDNKIMYVENGAMENVPLLRILILSNNMLIAFNRSTWNTLKQYDLDYVDISGNPLACQCDNDWLHDLANSSGMFLQQNETLCSVDSLSQLRGKPLLEFDPSKYCVPNIVLASTLPFVVLALLIGLLLAFHNRWLIRYKLFLVKLAVFGYREMQDAREHGEFIYDLNIIFTEEDEVWAREHLRPILEERLPNYDRYSFGDEDLTLGMHYLEAVHYAVENSFKTIVLLSRRAVRDNWFLIKFRTAMDHVHDELIENTVVIFLEDIPEDEIPYLVRLYLSDRRPYMRWPENVRGKKYFWNELTKVVTFNLKYNPLIPPE